MTRDDDAQIACAVYTHARRHPMVLGNIGGWTPPFQLTLVQAGVLLVTLGIEAKTYRLWSDLLPRTLTAVLAIGLPCALAWAVRKTRIEGRSLPRLAVGLVQYALAPRTGAVGGRRHRPRPRPVPFGGPVFVAAVRRRS